MIYPQVFAATQQSSGDLPVFIFSLIVWLLTVIGFWKMFQKAKQPGWTAIVPIYNLVMYLRIVGRPWWWIFFMIIPFINLIPTFFVSLSAAKVFGKSKAFGVVALWIFSFVGTLILGFGDAKYHPPRKAKFAKDTTEE